MPKRDLTARIDADIAKLQEIGSYVAKRMDLNAEGIGKSIDDDIAELRKMRDYVTDAPAAKATDPKPRKPRKKRGLPAADVTADALKF